MTQNEITAALYPSYVPAYAPSEPADSYGYSDSSERVYHHLDSANGLLWDHSTSASDLGEQRHNRSLEPRRVKAMPPVEGATLQTLKESLDGVAHTTRQMIAGAQLIGQRVGAVTTPILGSLSRGVTQTVVDAKSYERWATDNVESWGWNDTKFVYACGLAVRGASTLVGAAVGLAHGVWAGGKQAHDNYHSEGVLNGGWQAIANAFYACEPTSFSNTAKDHHVHAYQH